MILQIIDAQFVRLIKVCMFSVGSTVVRRDSPCSSGILKRSAFCSSQSHR